MSSQELCGPGRFRSVGWVLGLCLAARPLLKHHRELRLAVCERSLKWFPYCGVFNLCDSTFQARDLVQQLDFSWSAIGAPQNRNSREPPVLDATVDGLKAARMSPGATRSGTGTFCRCAKNPSPGHQGSTFAPALAIQDQEVRRDWEPCKGRSRSCGS